MDDICISREGIPYAKDHIFKASGGRIEIRTSPLHGFGVFAKRGIRRAEVVVRNDPMTCDIMSRLTNSSNVLRLPDNVASVHDVFDGVKRYVPGPDLLQEDLGSLTAAQDIRANAEITKPYSAGYWLIQYLAGSPGFALPVGAIHHVATALDILLRTDSEENREFYSMRLASMGRSSFREFAAARWMA